jgi:hypothetical protein
MRAVLSAAAYSATAARTAGVCRALYGDPADVALGESLVVISRASLSAELYLSAASVSRALPSARRAAAVAAACCCACACVCAAATAAVTALVLLVSAAVAAATASVLASAAML